METMKTIANRQSCRAYSGEQLNDNELQTIVMAANAAPKGSRPGTNLEVRLTVIQNSELLSKIDHAAADLFKIPNFKPSYGAPTVIFVHVTIPEDKQDLTSYCNAACAAENMVLAATDLGLGNVYLTSIIVALNRNKELCSELKVPEGFMPAAAIAVGKSGIPLAERELTLSNIVTEYIK